MRKPIIGRKYWTTIVQHAKIIKIGRSIMARRRNGDATMGCIVYAVLGLILMPLIGLFFVCSKDTEKKTWGWILLILGIILWIVFGVGST